MTAPSEKESGQDSENAAETEREPEEGTASSESPVHEEEPINVTDSAESEALPADDSAQRKSSSFGFGAIVLLLAVASGGAAGFFAAQFGFAETQATPPMDLTERFDPLEQSVDDLRDQVRQLGEQVTTLNADLAALAERPDVPAPVAIDLQPVEKALRDLQARVDQLDSSFAQVQSVSADGETGSDPELLTDLNRGIDELRASIADLEADLPGRIARLESSVVPADLESQLESFSTQDQYDALARRLSALESDPSGDLAQQAALALGLANLIRAIELGQSFETELDTLTALAPARREFAELRPMSVDGLKRPERLKTEFPELARLAIRKHNERPDASWWQQILTRLQALITIRPVGDVEGDTAEAVIARAEQRLEEGDLRSAARELRDLSGPAAGIFDEWLTEAEAHLRAEELLQTLSAEILRELGRLKG